MIQRSEVVSPKTPYELAAEANDAVLFVLDLSAARDDTQTELIELQRRLEDDTATLHEKNKAANTAVQTAGLALIKGFETGEIQAQPALEQLAGLPCKLDRLATPAGVLDVTVGAESRVKVVKELYQYVKEVGVPALLIPEQGLPIGVAPNSAIRPSYFSGRFGINFYPPEGESGQPSFLGFDAVAPNNGSKVNEIIVAYGPDQIAAALRAHSLLAKNAHPNKVDDKEISSLTHILAQIDRAGLTLADCGFSQHEIVSTGERWSELLTKVNGIDTTTLLSALKATDPQRFSEHVVAAMDNLAGQLLSGLTDRLGSPSQRVAVRILEIKEAIDGAMPAEDRKAFIRQLLSAQSVAPEA